MPCKNNDRLKDVKSAIFQVLMHCMCLVTCCFNSVVRFAVNLGYWHARFVSSFLLTTPALTLLAKFLAMFVNEETCCWLANKIAPCEWAHIWQQQCLKDAWCSMEKKWEDQSRSFVLVPNGTSAAWWNTLSIPRSVECIAVLCRRTSGQNIIPFVVADSCSTFSSFLVPFGWQVTDRNSAMTRQPCKLSLHWEVFVIALQLRSQLRAASMLLQVLMQKV